MREAGAADQRAAQGHPAGASLAPPPIFFRQRLWPASEIAGMAMSQWEALGEPFRAASQLTAMVMANHPEAIALFFALSACQAPILLLAPEPRSWRTSPPVPHGTRLVLTPAFAHLEQQATDLGLCVREAPGPATVARDRALPFLTCPGLVFLTSGSTGVPRPVYRSIRSLIASSSALAEALRFPDAVGVIAALPLDRAYGLNNGLMVATVLQRPLGLLERFVHNDMLSLCESGTYWYWAGTPVMADILSRSQRSGPLRMPPICAFAGRLSASVCRAFEARFGTPLRQIYGTTETLTVAADLTPSEDVRFETAGRPLAGVSVRIGDDPNTPAAAGASGKIWVRTPWFMNGYGFPPDVTCDGLLDGWWPTPDVGCLDADGRLMILGRLDDRIRSGAGHILDPRDILGAIETYPGVTDAAVVPVQTTAGTSFGVLVEVSEPIRALDLRNHLAMSLPSSMLPRTVKTVSRLPRLASGRLDRRACVDFLEGATRRQDPS